MKQHLIRLILVWISVFSTVCGFLSAFASRQNSFGSQTGVVFALILISGSVVYLIDHIDNVSLKRKLQVALIAAFILAGVIMSTFLFYSFWGLLGEMNIGISRGDALSPELFIFYITCVISAVEMILMLHRKMKTMIMIDTVILLIPIICGSMPGVLYICAALVFAVGALTLRTDDHWALPAQTMGAVAVICLLIIMLVPQRNFHQWSIFSYVRGQFASMFDGKDEEPEQTMTSGGVNGGSIGNVDEIVYSNETMLTLKSGFTGSVYLKGFTGAIYENNQWRDFYDSEYITDEHNYEELFKNLSEYHISSSTQTAELFRAVESSEDCYLKVSENLESYLSRILRRKFTVIYEEEEIKFSFIPYSSLYSIQKKSSYDGYYLNEKASLSAYAYENKKLDYDFWKSYVDDYTGDQENLLQYQEWESAYREFVYDRYVQMDEEQKNALSQALTTVPQFYSDGTAKSVISYGDEVKQYFQDHFTYTLSPGKVPEGKDAITYFMDENPYGYCTYFASAATLIFRNAGIPCRYVEGYSTYVSQGTASSSETVTDQRSSGTFSATDTYTRYTVDVKDSDAHAWVEIYMDGYGWIPVDVTPGYQNRQDENFYASVDSQSDVNILKEGTDSETDTSYLNSDGTFNEEYYENVEQDGDSYVEPHVKDHYDTFAEYMKDNTSGRIDFKIVMPIMGRYLLSVLKVIAIVVMILFFAAISFVIPERMSKKKRRGLMTFSKNQSMEERKNQVLGIYSYMERLGKFMKVERLPEESYMEYGERLSAHSDFFDVDDVTQITKVTMKAAFSENQINDDEIKMVIHAIVQIIQNFDRKLSKIKRIVFQYIWHLR